MPYYRINLLMNTIIGEPAGHSERWDFDVPSDDLAFSLAQKLANRRADFMPQDWVISGIRVGNLSVFHTVSHGYRFKQTSVQICQPANTVGKVSGGEIIGGAVYYRFHYSPAPGRPAIRLFTPIPEGWWSGSGSTAKAIKDQADGEIQPFSRWLISNKHRLLRIDQTTGTVTPYPLSCVDFRRSAVKKVGRVFFQRRGRRFAHRTPRP